MLYPNVKCSEGQPLEMITRRWGHEGVLPMTPLVTFWEEKVKTQLPCLFCRWMLPPMLACSKKALNRLSGHHHHALESGANRLLFFLNINYPTSGVLLPQQKQTKAEVVLWISSVMTDVSHKVQLLTLWHCEMAGAVWAALAGMPWGTTSGEDSFRAALMNYTELLLDAPLLHEYIIPPTPTPREDISV